MEKVAGRCEGCPATGSDVGSRGLRQVSLRKHLDDAVNRALQMDHGDFIVSHRPVTKQLGLVVVDERSTYGELDPFASRSEEHAQLPLTTRWILQHGAPEQLSGDPAFNNAAMRAFCVKHDIVWSPRPPRCHDSIGLVERRIGVIKQVLERLVVSNDNLTPGQRTPHVELLQQANILVNIYVGTGTLSSFQVFGGYQPSLLGMPPTVVTQDMLAAHQQLVAVRALSRLLRSKRFDPYSRQLRVNQEVYVYAQNKPGSAKDAVGWSRHHVVALHPSLAHTRPLHQKRGRPHMVSYADVRPIPADPIAQSAFVLALTAECTPSGRCLHGGN
jgi:hypothetical protein